MYDPTKPYKRQVLDQVRRTWGVSPYLKVIPGIYPVFERRPLSDGGQAPLAEIDHTDGIGTKGIYHFAQRTFAAAAVDALAMNLNDLAMVLAEPYKLQDHIAIQADDHQAILEVVTALADRCLPWRIVMTGGETSVMDSFRGIEVSLTVSGFIRRRCPDRCRIGDVLIGLPSSGLHANGFTLVRRIFGDDCRRPELVEPTAIYLGRILDLSRRLLPNAMMNITGGALAKLKDILGDGQMARLYRNHRLMPQPIFREIHAAGIAEAEMYRTLNCGIGFVLAVRPQDTRDVLLGLGGIGGVGGDVIGEIVPGPPGQKTVEVASAFSPATVVL